MADSTPADDYLHTLKNLPKLPGPDHSGDSLATRNWCSSETPLDDGEDEDDFTIDVGAQSSSFPMSFLTRVQLQSNPTSSHSVAKGKTPVKRKPSTVASNADPASLLSIGLASNTRSMRNQTDASFLAAGGEPSSSAVPPKKKRKTKEANVVPLDAS